MICSLRERDFLIGKFPLAEINDNYSLFIKLGDVAIYFPRTVLRQKDMLAHYLVCAYISFFYYDFWDDEGLVATQTRIAASLPVNREGEERETFCAVF